MTTLYAQPYDISATGFYFDSAEDYAAKVRDLRNDCGQPVEEFEIQFIDGAPLDGQLFETLRVHQGDTATYFDVLDEWTDDEKIKVIIAVGEVGYRFDLSRDRPDRFEVDLYECDTLRDLAMQFVDEGLFGEIPAAIQNYLDYDAIARDLAMDYGQITIDGTRYIYRCD